MTEGDDDVVADTLLGGRLVLYQFRKGHRAGTDAVLLAAAAGVVPGDRFVDVGSGSGAVGLALALAQSEAQGVLLEADSAAAALARRNVEANRLGDRVAVRRLDLFDQTACREAGLTGSATLVVTNPPFFETGTVRSSPDPRKASAHMLTIAGPDGHAAWITRAISLLGPHGRLVVIHRTAACVALLGAMAKRLGNLTVRPVHAKADQPALRILIGGRMGSKAPLQMLPPLILHAPDGSFTDESAALHAGEPMPLWPKESRPRRAGWWFKSNAMPQ